MRRFSHFLKGNLRSEQVHSACWVDTETQERPLSDGGVEHRLVFGWACYQRTRRGGAWLKPEWHRFTSRAGFWAWLESRLRPRTRTFVFAHNWAFDAPVLGVFTDLLARGWMMTGAIIDSPPVIIKLRRDTMTLTLLDTLNWWRVPLKSLGESLSLPKLEMPSRRAGRAAWDRYARRDVEIIHAALHAWWVFLARYDLGGFAPTLASQAFRAFRHRFLSHPILIDDHTEALDLARRSLHGGRVECFRIGRVRGPVYHLDVNSMYPYVMHEHQFPTVLRLCARRVTIKECQTWLETMCVTADCSLRTEEPCYPSWIDNRLCFPVGCFRAVLSTPELRHAIAHGHLVAIHQAAVYERAPIFHRFIAEVYALRQEAAARGDEVNRYLLKILMNSLYGKFAQRGTTWETVGEAEDDDARVWTEIDADTGEITHFRQFAGQQQRRSRATEAFDSHPAIAAHVTAEARMHLWTLATRAGFANVYYCDTDSLMLNKDGARRLEPWIDPSRLGYLKLEARYPRLTLYGPKDYIAGSHRVVKGVRLTAQWIDDNTVVQERWSRLIGMIRSGRLDAPTTHQQQKVLQRTYQKGTVLPSGQVLPLRVTAAE